MRSQRMKLGLEEFENSLDRIAQFSENPIPLERTAPCLISGHETEDKTPNERDQPGLIDNYFPLVNAHR